MQRAASGPTYEGWLAAKTRVEQLQAQRQQVFDQASRMSPERRDSFTQPRIAALDEQITAAKSEQQAQSAYLKQR